MKATKWLGLFNTISAYLLPPTAAVIQNNLQSIRPGMLTPRRGMARRAGTLLGNAVLALYRKTRARLPDHLILYSFTKTATTSGGAAFSFQYLYSAQRIQQDPVTLTYRIDDVYQDTGTAVTCVLAINSRVAVTSSTTEKVRVGDKALSASIPDGTVVQAVTATTITLSQAATVSTAAGQTETMTIFPGSVSIPSFAEDRHGRLYMFFGNGIKPQMLRTDATTTVDVGIESPQVLATVSASGASMFIERVDVYNGGGGYSQAPAISFAGGGTGIAGFAAAKATAIIDNGTIASVEVTSGGKLYTSTPQVTVTDTGRGAGFAGVAKLSIEEFRYGPTVGVPITPTYTGNVVTTIGTTESYLYSYVSSVPTVRQVGATANATTVVGSKIITLTSNATMQIIDGQALVGGGIPASSVVVKVTPTGQYLTGTTVEMSLAASASATVAVSFYTLSGLSFDIATREYSGIFPFLSTATTGTGAQAQITFAEKSSAFKIGMSPTPVTSPADLYTGVLISATYEPSVHNPPWNFKTYYGFFGGQPHNWGLLAAANYGRWGAYTRISTSTTPFGVPNAPHHNFWFPDYTYIRVFSHTGTKSNQNIDQWTAQQCPVVYVSARKAYIDVTLFPEQASDGVPSPVATDATNPVVRFYLSYCPTWWAKDYPDPFNHLITENAVLYQQTRTTERWRWLGSATSPKPIVDFWQTGHSANPGGYNANQIENSQFGWNQASSFLVIHPGSGHNANATFKVKFVVGRTNTPYPSTKDGYARNINQPLQGGLPVSPADPTYTNGVFDITFTADTSDAGAGVTSLPWTITKSVVAAQGSQYNTAGNDLGIVLTHTTTATGVSSANFTNIKTTGVKSSVENPTDRIETVTVSLPGANYTGQPTFFIDAPSGSGYGAELSAVIDPVAGGITKVNVIDGGHGYTDTGFLIGTATLTPSLSAVMRPTFKGTYSCAYRYADWTDTVVGTCYATATSGGITQPTCIVDSDGQALIKTGYVLDGGLFRFQTKATSVSGASISLNRPTTNRAANSYKAAIPGSVIASGTKFAASPAITFAEVGMSIAGSGIPANTTVTSIVSPVTTIIPAVTATTATCHTMAGQPIIWDGTRVNFVPGFLGATPTIGLPVTGAGIPAGTTVTAIYGAQFKSIAGCSAAAGSNTITTTTAAPLNFQSFFVGQVLQSTTLFLLNPVSLHRITAIANDGLSLTVSPPTLNLGANIAVRGMPTLQISANATATSNFYAISPGIPIYVTMTFTSVASYSFTTSELTLSNVATSTSEVTLSLVSPVVKRLGSTALNSTTVTTNSTIGFQIGQHISGAGIPGGTYILAMTDATITLTNQATATSASPIMLSCGWLTTIRDMTKPIAYSNFSPIATVSAGSTANSTGQLNWLWGSSVTTPDRAEIVETWRTNGDQSLVFYRSEVWAKATPQTSIVLVENVPGSAALTLQHALRGYAAGSNSADYTSDEALFDFNRTFYAAMPVVLPNGGLNAFRFDQPRTDMRVCAAYNDRLWYAVSTSGVDTNTIFFSEYDEFESCPETNALTIQNNQKLTDSLTSLIPYGSVLIAGQENHLYQVTYSTDPAVDASVSMLAHRGIYNQRCWDIYDDELYCLDRRGMYTMTQSGQVTPISAAVDSYWIDRDIEATRTEAFFIKIDSSAAVVRAFVVVHDANAPGPNLVLCYSINTKTWWTETYPTCITAASSFRPESTLIHDDVYAAIDGGVYALDGQNDIGYRSITSVEVTANGSGYITPPNVVAATSQGSGAKFQALLKNGTVSEILVIDRGTDYGVITSTVGRQGTLTLASSIYTAVLDLPFLARIGESVTIQRYTDSTYRVLLGAAQTVTIATVPVFGGATYPRTVFFGTLALVTGVNKITVEDPSLLLVGQALNVLNGIVANTFITAIVGNLVTLSTSSSTITTVRTQYKSYSPKQFTSATAIIATDPAWGVGPWNVTVTTAETATAVISQAFTDSVALLIDPPGEGGTTATAVAKCQTPPSEFVLQGNFIVQAGDLLQITFALKHPYFQGEQVPIEFRTSLFAIVPAVHSANDANNTVTGSWYVYAVTDYTITIMATGAGAVDTTGLANCTAQGSGSQRFTVGSVYKTGALELVADDNTPKIGSNFMDRSVTVLYQPTSQSTSLVLREYYNNSDNPRINQMARNRGTGFIHELNGAQTTLDMSISRSALGVATGVAKAIFGSRTASDMSGADTHIAVELIIPSVVLEEETDLATPPEFYGLTINGIVGNEAKD